MQRQLVFPFALGLVALAVQNASAQNSTSPDDVYVMVTTAIHQRSAETALPVTLLTGDQLHTNARATLGDTLALQPGISNASFGPAVGQTVIRGQQGRRVMNLTNSVPNADASGNSADHAQTVEPLLASSIEVLRGPATLLYGGGAIGGVINVIDQRIANKLPEKFDLAVESRYDSSSQLKSNVVGTNFATGSLAWHFDAVQRDWNDMNIPGLAVDPAWLRDAKLRHPALDNSHANETGHLSNTGGSTTTATGGVSWIGESGHAGLAVSHLDNHYGLPPAVFIDASNPLAPVLDSETDLAIKMQNTRVDFNGQWLNPANWMEKLDYSLARVDYEHVEMEGATPGTRFSNDSWQQRLQMTMAPVKGWHTVIGLQHNDDEFAAVGSESFIPETDIRSSGLFIVGDYHAGEVTYELGARINRDAYSPQNAIAPDHSFSTASYSGSALWDVSGPLTIGLSLSRSERAPSVEELYSNHGLGVLDDCVIHHASGACEIGDDRFRKERSFNTDLSFTWSIENLKTTVTFFNNRFDDYIALLADGREVAGEPVRVYQQEDARFHGIEVDLNWQITDKLLLRFYGDSIRGTLASSGDMPRLPPWHAGVELGYRTANWSLRMDYLHAAAQDRPGKLELGSDSWAKLEIGADYRLDLGSNGELLVFLTARNLLDEEIRLSTSYLRSFAPEAGRSLETGVRYRF